MAYLLALASAVLYGAADFLGGLAARRATTIAVVVASQFAGMVLVALLIPFFPSADPSTRDLMFGALAGVSGGVGVALLYRALAIGMMALVAPTTAVCAVAIPVLAGVLLGERPAPLTVAGMALALIAIVLISLQKSQHGKRPGAAFSSGIGLALLSGVAIGAFFLSLDQATEAAGLWPLLTARLASVAFFLLFALAGARPLRMAAPVAVIAIAGGFLDMLANALYLFSTHTGPLSVVVTLCSLYPASTVILARLVLGERLSQWQTVGIACALVAVALIVSP